MTFSFGKHAGKPLANVPGHYLQWALGDGHNGQPVIKNDTFRREVERELARRGDGDGTPGEYSNRPHNGEQRAYEPHSAAPTGAREWMNRPATDRAHDELRSLLIRIEQRLTAIESALGLAVAADDYTPF